MWHCYRAKFFLGTSASQLWVLSPLIFYCNTNHVITIAQLVGWAVTANFVFSHAFVCENVNWKKKLCVLRRRGATVHRYYWTLHCIGFVHQSIFKWIKYILHIFYEMWRGKCMIDLVSNKKLRYIVPNAWPIIAKFELLINRILECFNKKERNKFLRHNVAFAMIMRRYRSVINIVRRLIFMHRKKRCFLQSKHHQVKATW